MAHHYSDDDPELRARFEQFLKDVPRRPSPLGATGRYPEGKYTENDGGEICFAVAADPTAGKVLIDFGKPVMWVGMTPDEARGLADLLRSKAEAADGRKETKG